MNELIGTIIITMLVFVMGSMIYVCGKIGPIVINFVKSFIKWHRKTGFDIYEDKEL